MLSVVVWIATYAQLLSLGRVAVDLLYFFPKCPLERGKPWGMEFPLWEVFCYTFDVFPGSGTLEVTVSS